MSIQEYFSLLRNRKQTVLNFIIIFMALLIAVSFLQSFKYRASSKLIVLQKYESGFDPYNIARSADYLSGILARVVTSESFMDEVLMSNISIDRSYFPHDSEKRLKKWEKTVSAVSVKDFGMIELTVYHPDKRQAQTIAETADYVLKTKHRLYHGNGTAASVEIISEPIVSGWPVKPNLPLNVALAVFGGMTAGLVFVYYFPEVELNLRRDKNKKSDNGTMNLMI